MDSGSIGLGWTQDAVFLRSSQDVLMLLVQGPEFEQQGAGIFVCPAQSLLPGRLTVRATSVGSEPQANSYVWPMRSIDKRSEGRRRMRSEVFIPLGIASYWVAIGWLHPSTKGPTPIR